MGEQTGPSANELIIQYMPLAKRIGIKYATRHSRMIDEAVAEAYFQLVILFREKFPIYLQADNKDLLVGVCVKRELIRYFELRGSRENRELTDKINLNTDEEMIDWLSGLFGCDDAAFRVFHLLRDGMTLDKIELTDPLLTKIAKRLKLAVSGRMKRLEHLKESGLKTTREVKQLPLSGDTDDESGSCVDVG